MYNERDRTQRSNWMSMRMCPRQTNQRICTWKAKKNRRWYHHTMLITNKGKEMEFKERVGRKGRKGYYTVEGNRWVMGDADK